jgi:hypothetical protein
VEEEEKGEKNHVEWEIIVHSKEKDGEERENMHKRIATT